jgi:hypothetical protein
MRESSLIKRIYPLRKVDDSGSIGWPGNTIKPALYHGIPALKGGE